jgi:hypothetical protein
MPTVLASFLLIPMLRFFCRALATAASVVVIGTRGWHGRHDQACSQSQRRECMRKLELFHD